MPSQYFIGVDIGTAGTKAAIFDLQGNQLATAYEESKLYYLQVGRARARILTLLDIFVDPASLFMER